APPSRAREREQTPRGARLSFGVPRVYGVELAPGLRHQRTLWVGEDEVLEVLDRARHVAFPAERARPFQIRLGGLRCGGVLREDPRPDRNRLAVLVPRAVNARREREQQRGRVGELVRGTLKPGGRLRAVAAR